MNADRERWFMNDYLKNAARLREMSDKCEAINGVRNEALDHRADFYANLAANIKQDLEEAGHGTDISTN